MLNKYLDNCIKGSNFWVRSETSGKTYENLLQQEPFCQKFAGKKISVEISIN